MHIRMCDRHCQLPLCLACIPAGLYRHLQPAAAGRHGGEGPRAAHGLPRPAAGARRRQLRLVDAAVSSTTPGTPDCGVLNARYTRLWTPQRPVHPTVESSTPGTPDCGVLNARYTRLWSPQPPVHPTVESSTPGTPDCGLWNPQPLTDRRVESITLGILCWRIQCVWKPGWMFHYAW